jgi:hypothetical protein
MPVTEKIQEAFYEANPIFNFTLYFYKKWDEKSWTLLPNATRVTGLTETKKTARLVSHKHASTLNANDAFKASFFCLLLMVEISAQLIS